MIVDALLLACGAFGAAAFGFALGLCVQSAKKGVQIYPATHVSFDRDLDDQQRLKFLSEASDAVREGRLSQAKKLADDSPSDKEE